MKKIFTFLSSSLFSLSLLAYDGIGLSITAVNKSMNYSVEVDGRKVFMKDNSVTLANLGEGYHNVRIYRESRGNDFGYGFGRKDQLIYSTAVLLDRTYHTDVIISRSGKVYIDSYKINRETIWYDDAGGGNNDADRCGNGGGLNSGYADVMNASEFQAAKSTISQEWFESSRLILAKTIIDENSFTTQQVKELMFLFAFENNRLELAKYAFGKTTDQQNYMLIGDALTFSSNKNELARFIRESF